MLTGNALTSFSPLFTQLLGKRNLFDPKEIEAFIAVDLEDLENPFDMKGMDEAFELIQKTIREKKKILIHGDYDVDGVTATALLARTLTKLGANFFTFLPDRSADGYGVNERAIQDAHQKGVSLLITADCGITALAEISLARSLGLEVIVIDHHRIPQEGLPPATVILNPQQADCPYPFKELSAAGLAFKLSQALIGPQAFEFLDLAALSTVCDVAPLLGENRIIVKKGLELLSERRSLGIRALLQASSLKAAKINTAHVGFVLGPRINAAGRMSSPEIALRLLLSESPREAESLALVLEEENKARQKEERRVTREAIEEAERVVNFNRDRVIVVGRPGWHPGVIGIVASRLVEKYHRPSIVIAFENGTGKGSGRSIKNFHLFLALEACRDLFEEFGGHEQAAGLTMREGNLSLLRSKINSYAKDLDPEIFVRKITADLEIKLEDLNPAFIREMELLEPYGVGNPRPVFMTRGLVVKAKPEHLTPETLRLWISDGILTFEAVCSERLGRNRLPLEKGARLDWVYGIKIKSWNGEQSLVLEVKDIRSS